MPLDNFVLPELINRAKELIEHCGAKYNKQQIAGPLRMLLQVHLY
jgi:hypothetical protein